MKWRAYVSELVLGLARLSSECFMFAAAECVVSGSSLAFGAGLMCALGRVTLTIRWRACGTKIGADQIRIANDREGRAEDVAADTTDTWTNQRTG